MKWPFERPPVSPTEFHIHVVINDEQLSSSRQEAYGKVRPHVNRR